MTLPTTLTLQHPSKVSVPEVLGVVNSIIQTDAEPVVSSLPIGASTQATAISWIGLGELGLEIVQQIAVAISALNAKNTAANS